jgi:bacterioferritin-associated ferredoxin
MNSVINKVQEFTIIVCLCEGISEREVLEAARDPRMRVQDFVSCTGGGADCGTCRTSLERLFKSAQKGEIRSKVESPDACPLKGVAIG